MWLYYHNYSLFVTMCIAIAMSFCRFDLAVDEDHTIERYAIVVLKALNGIKLKLNYMCS